MSLEKMLFDFYKVPFPAEEYIDNQNCCFICGENGKKLTDEHLFPKWLLGGTNSYDTQLTLPNNTKTFFRNITIPCCISCNNEVLSFIDNKVKNIFDKECVDVTNEEREIIYHWMLKISSGLFLKGAGLKSNRRDPGSDSLTTKNHLARRELLFSLTKAIKYKVTFTNFTPYSLILFEFDPGQIIDYPFAFMSNYNYPTFAFAYKKMALIIAIGEDGEIRNCFPAASKIEFSKIDTPTFLRHFCSILTAHSLRNNTSGHVSITSPLSTDLRLSKFTEFGKEDVDNFKPWDKEVFEKYFEFYKKFTGLA